MNRYRLGIVAFVALGGAAFATGAATAAPVAVDLLATDAEPSVVQAQYDPYYSDPYGRGDRLRYRDAWREERLRNRDAWRAERIRERDAWRAERWRERRAWREWREDRWRSRNGWY